MEAMSEPVVLLEISERIATITLNRPSSRNALSNEVVKLMAELMLEAERRDDVDVLILTGADPAFCAGLDLRQVAGGSLINSQDDTGASGGINAYGVYGPFPNLTKPLIGAINGAAVTGGFELALNCDFLVASDRAKFGDTHARVGVMPGWGLTVHLSRTIGVRRAREMSFTGNFLSADEAYHFGLVNHVVPHEDLIPFTRQIARDISGINAKAVRQIRATYNEINADHSAWEIETRDSKLWLQNSYDASMVEANRAAIIDRGRKQ